MNREIQGDNVLAGLSMLLFVSLFSSTSGIGLASGLFLLLGAWHFRKEWPQAIDYPLFGSLLVLSSVILLSIVLSDPYQFIKPLGKLRYYWLYFVLLLLFWRKPGTVDRIDKVAVPLGILLGAVALVQSITGFLPMRFLGLGELPKVPNYQGTLYHARGFVFHHVPFAFNCVLLYHWLLSPVLTKGWKQTRLAHRLAVGMLAVAVLLSFSRGAWMAFIGSNLALGFSLWGRSGLKYLAAFVMLLIAVLFSVPGLRDRALAIRPSQNTDRLLLWEISYRMFKESPVLGQGFHSFADRRHVFATEAEKSRPHFPVDPHSMYFDMLGGTGIVGFFAFIAFIVQAFANYFRSLTRTASPILRGRIGAGIGCLAAFCIAGLFDSHNAITYTLVGTIYFLALGHSAVINALGQKAQEEGYPLGLTQEPAV